MVTDLGLTTRNKVGTVAAVLLVILTLSLRSVNIYTDTTGA